MKIGVAWGIPSVVTAKIGGWGSDDGVVTEDPGSGTAAAVHVPEKLTGGGATIDSAAMSGGSFNTGAGSDVRLTTPDSASGNAVSAEGVNSGGDAVGNTTSDNVSAGGCKPSRNSYHVVR